MSEKMRYDLLQDTKKGHYNYFTANSRRLEGDITKSKYEVLNQRRQILLIDFQKRLDWTYWEKLLQKKFTQSQCFWSFTVK